MAPISVKINTDELCAPPEVCGPDAESGRQEHLLAHNTGERDGRLTSFLKRDKPLVHAIVALVLLMNIPKLSHVLYPFEIFSTWIHELSHGMAAVMVGGGIDKLLVYPDTSGLAWTYTDGSSTSRGIVASAGYTGTAALGMVMLLFRRTYRGPTVGMITLGIIILLSCLLYVHNKFALVFLPCMAAVMILCAWKLKARNLTYLYSFFALTCSFNAVDNISELYGPVGYVNGEEATSDATTVAEYWGGPKEAWATAWLSFALACSAFGLLCPLDGSVYKTYQRQRAVGNSVGLRAPSAPPAAKPLGMPVLY